MRKAFFPKLGTFFFDKKKVEFLPLKLFCSKLPIQVRFQLFFFSTKVWTSKSENLVLCDHPTKIDDFCTVQHLTLILKFFKLNLRFNLKSRCAVEISDQKILIFEKFKFSTFTGKRMNDFGLELTIFETVLEH